MSLLKAMLDTNIVSALMRSPGEGKVHDKLLTYGTDRVCISVISSAEIQFGFAKHASPRLQGTLRLLLDGIQILPFEAPADRSYGRIRAGLERAGTVIGANDLLIAAHALALDLTLVTDNIREFSRVPNLRVENWLD